MTLQYLIPNGLQKYCDLIYTRGTFGYNSPIIALILMSERVIDTSYYPLDEDSYIIGVEADILINLIFNKKLNRVGVWSKYFDFTIIKTECGYVYNWKDEYYHDYQILNKIYPYINAGMLLNLEWKDEFSIEHQHYTFTVHKIEKKVGSTEVLLMSLKSKIIIRPILKQRSVDYVEEYLSPLQDEKYILAEEFRQNFEFLVGKDIMIKNDL